MSLSTVRPQQTEQIMAFMCTMCHLKAPTEDEVKRHIFKVHLGQPVIKTDTEIPLELHLGTLQPPPPPEQNPPTQQIRFVHQPENANHSHHTIIIEDPSGNSILPKKEAVIEIIDDSGYRHNTSSILEPLVLDSVSSAVTNPNVNDLICAFCAFNTNDVNILESHIKSVHPNSGNSYPCMFCNFKATNSIRLFCTHLRVVHGNEIKSALSYHNTNATTSITTSSAPSTTIVDNGVTAHSIVSELMANENNQIIVSDDLNSTGGFQIQIVEPQSQQVSVTTAATPTVTTNNFVENNSVRTQTGAALPSDPSKWFRCDSCNFVAGNARKLQHHKESRHLGIRYQCKQCTSSYTIRDKLTFHYSKQHNITSYKVTEEDKIRVSFNMEIESKKFSCDLCDMKFTTRSAMYKHKRAKHLGLQYKCHLCNYSTGYRRGLKSHYENKHKDKNYTIPRALNGVFETAAVVQGEPKQIVG